LCLKKLRPLTIVLKDSEIERQEIVTLLNHVKFRQELQLIYVSHEVHKT